MKTISFVVYQEPTGKKAVHHTRSGIAYPCKEQKYNENALFTEMLKYRPPEPIADPVELIIKAIFPVPASKPLWWREEALIGNIRHDKKPDCDNLYKQAGDALETLQFVKNDSQIFHGDVKKEYGLNPRWEIQIIIHPQLKRRTR